MGPDDRVCCQACDVKQGAWTSAVVELVALILGLIGVSMLMGWTLGVSISLREYYTPPWACIVIQVILSLLILTLFLAMVGLYFNKAVLIMPHITLLIISWAIVLVIMITVSILGGPILTSICVLLFFTLILGFGWTLYQGYQWMISMGR